MKRWISPRMIRLVWQLENLFRRPTTEGAIKGRQQDTWWIKPASLKRNKDDNASKAYHAHNYGFHIQYSIDPHFSINILFRCQPILNSMYNFCAPWPLDSVVLSYIPIGTQSCPEMHYVFFSLISHLLDAWYRTQTSTFPHVHISRQHTYMHTCLFFFQPGKVYELSVYIHFHFKILVKPDGSKLD